jgi:hypothetical protein
LSFEAINGATISQNSKYGTGSLLLNNPDQLDISTRQIISSSSSSQYYDICDVWTIAFWWNPARINYERGFTTILSGNKNGLNYDSGGWVFNHMNNYNGGTTGQYSIQQWNTDMNQWIYLAWENHVPATNVWEHIVIVKNNNSLDLYINGIKQTRTFTANDIYVGYAPSLNSNLVIGTDLLDDAATPGIIDEIIIYTSKALSDAQILCIYENMIDS